MAHMQAERLGLVLPATGWSVWVHNILVREKDAEMKEDEHHLELGSLLKRKVRVLALCGSPTPVLGQFIDS
jgi:hypothetical protein